MPKPLSTIHLFFVFCPHSFALSLFSSVVSVEIKKKKMIEHHWKKKKKQLFYICKGKNLPLNTNVIELCTSLSSILRTFCAFGLPTSFQIQYSVFCVCFTHTHRTQTLIHNVWAVLSMFPINCTAFSVFFIYCSPLRFPRIFFPPPPILPFPVIYSFIFSRKKKKDI